MKIATFVKKIVSELIFRKKYLFFFVPYLKQIKQMDCQWNLHQILSMANIFMGHCRKYSCQKKSPQSFVLQTMMCLENSIRVCHFWHLNRKFVVEHEKDCVGYGATYTNGTTRTFQKCKKKVLKPMKDLQLSSICKTKKTANQPATLLIFNFLQSSHAIPAGNKRNCFYQKRSTSFQKVG